MIAVFLLDESCLRYYLAFADNLRSLLIAWSIGEQGLGAYRPQFCSRTLVTHFSWGECSKVLLCKHCLNMWNFAVWLQLLAVKAFLTPAKQLVQAQPRWKQATATLTAWAACLLRKILRDREEPALSSCKKALKVRCSHWRLATDLNGVSHRKLSNTN